MKWNIPWDRWRETGVKKGLEWAEKYKYVLLVIFAGVALLVWPAGKPASADPSPPPSRTPEEDFSVSALEEKLSQTLSRIHGAGDVTVVLTVQGGSRRVLAENTKTSRDNQGDSQDTRETVVLGSGGAEGPVLVQQLYPKFQGALVVCEGGGDAGVRLKLMEAVSALTGLGADKISICKGKG